MRCDRYWRDGILLVEQGRPDPHRDTCLDCRREHEARNELVRALGDVSAREAGSTGWQQRVLGQIAREAAPPRRRWIALPGALVATGAVAALAVGVFVLVPISRPDPGPDTPKIEMVAGRIARRAQQPSVDDAVKVTVRASQEIWIYRDDKLQLRCAASTTSDAQRTMCTRDGDHLVMQYTFSLVGAYQLVIVLENGERPVLPTGGLDRDVAALTSAGGAYQFQEHAVR